MTWAALVEALAPYRGRRFLGIVDSGGDVELVFAGVWPKHERNLITLHADGRVSHGSVEHPDWYARRAA